MGTFGGIASYAVMVFCGAIFYRIAYLLLVGYITYLENTKADNLSKREKIGIAFLVPVIAGAGFFLIWIIKVGIKSGIYSENTDATFNIVSLFISLGLFLGLHIILSAGRRRGIDAHYYVETTNMESEIRRLKEKITDLEADNHKLRSSKDAG